MIILTYSASRLSMLSFLLCGAQSFLQKNLFGYKSNNLGSLYNGLVKDTFVNFKHLRKTEHTDYALDDTRVNAEVLLQLKDEYGLKISLK